MKGLGPPLPIKPMKRPIQPFKAEKMFLQIFYVYVYIYSKSVLRGAFTGMFFLVLKNAT